jgi:hypothetical protein
METGGVLEEGRQLPLLAYDPDQGQSQWQSGRPGSGSTLSTPHEPGAT